MKNRQDKTRCGRCVFRHKARGYEPYTCDFALLAAPLTRGGVPPEKCRHYVEGRRIQNRKELEKALKVLGLG